MEKTMSPSKKTTKGQINKAVAMYRALLEKYAPEFESSAVQQVLGQKELAKEQFQVLRCRVEVVSNLIIRTVKVNRSRSPKEAIVATGRVEYTNDDVVKSMPHGVGDNVEVIFFKIGKSVSEDSLENEYALRVLVPADPYSLAAVNEADSAFADSHPNGTHWKDENGKWCYAAFDRWGGERSVGVDRSVYDWGGYWWFAGLRK